MKREPGIDLIRLTGLFFVVGVHFFLYNGFYYAPQKGWAIWLADCVRWLFFSCNGIFMMLTGYLRSRKPLGPGYCRCLIPVLLAARIIFRAPEGVRTVRGFSIAQRSLLKNTGR